MTAAAQGRKPAASLAGDDLRVRVHRHLRLHPMLTAYEVARALGLRHGADSVRRQLARMEGGGEAERHLVPRAPGDLRPAVRWVAT